MLKKRSTCRLCLSTKVPRIYSMPACPPVDNYRFAHEPEIDLPPFPMDLHMCSACGHAQLLDVVDPKILFGSYIYTSGSSPDLDVHFTDYAKTVAGYASLDSASFVVDLGSNDGLLLSKFSSYGVRVYGVDASENVANQAMERGIPTKNSFVNRAVVNELISQEGLADVVCANNVFSHSDDLRGFAECARDLLKPNGIFVFEVSYLKDLVHNKVIDYIYHEHLAHHSVYPLKFFFESLGMRIFDVQRVATKGGSIRCYAALSKSGWATQAIVDEMIAEEKAMGLYTPEIYERLKSEMDLVGENSRAVLELEFAKGNTLACYGASATTTVIRAMFDIDKYFALIVDDNPSRNGRLSPGSRIPVRSKAEFLEAMPSITFIGAWRFAELIISRNRAYLEAGGKFLVPLPDFRIVTNSSR